MIPTQSTELRLGGWGLENVEFEPPERMLAWLTEQLGEPVVPQWSAQPVEPPPGRPFELGDLPSTLWSREPVDRLRHAVGQSLPDVLRHRFGRIERLPDAIVRPTTAGEIATLFAAAERFPVRFVPWGGGSSVTGGVNVPQSDLPVVTVDLERLSGCLEFDETSALATFGAGTRGPQIEAALAARGWTLGHFPQSFEHSTLGGWIVTHSSGQESLGYGSIESMVAGLEMVSPAGRLELPALPASSTGPNLRQWVLGSEGRFGIVTRATVKVRPIEECFAVEAGLFPDWPSGMEACRAMLRQGVPLSLLRLSDEPETEVALTVGLGEGALARLVRTGLRLRGIRGHGCLLLVGAKGSYDQAARSIDRARHLATGAGAVWLGRSPGRKWKKDRFRHPYLRDALLDRGFATETLETAAPWSQLGPLYHAVRKALGEGVAGDERQLPVLCHLSHPYPDGASLYFTFFFRCPPDADEAIARWADLKRRASNAIAAAGGATSHHHGVGRWHAPWLRAETGELGAQALGAVAEHFDPQGLLNPGVLLDPRDRLQQ